MNFFGDPQSASRSQPATSDRETVTVVPVPEDAWPELIAWIDPLKDQRQVAVALSEMSRRCSHHTHCPQPLEALVQSQRVAAAYMVPLGARVAALGGVRGIDNHTNTAVQLLSSLVAQVRAAGMVQIQAILDAAESVATEIVSLAGFVPLAELLQVSLLLPTVFPTTNTPAKLPDGYRWQPAAQATRAELTQLLAHTFIETLDCPVLNGLRTPEDVLDGFLDGESLQSRQHWWVIEHAGKLVGCALVNPLPDAAAELVYMGLGPTSRGRGLGRCLLEQAIRSAIELRAEVFLAAVDAANWPATRIYFQAGFTETARVQAWFHRLES